MPLPASKTKIGAALIAAVLASGGGIAFLHKHPNPTLREVFAACEAGQMDGIACCEDMHQVKNWQDMMAECGAVAPGSPDPFGVRKLEEDGWDAELAAEQKGK